MGTNRTRTVAIFVLLGVLLLGAAAGLLLTSRTQQSRPEELVQNPLTLLNLTKFEEGVKAPDFTLPDPDGQKLSLKSFRGKAILLNFWATWCISCQWEMPEMEKLYQTYKRDGFVVLAVSIDQQGPDAVKQFLQKSGLTFPTVIDQEGTVARQYGVRGLPITYFINPHGEIVAGAAGPRHWSGEEAFRFVEELLRPPKG